MTFKITLEPSGHCFDAPAGTSILQAAAAAGFTLPYGCSYGVCGACKGKVLSGTVDHGGANDQALSDSDKDAGLTLFCCATPLSDLTLEVREIAANKDIVVKTLPCRVQKMDRLADDVMSLQLKLPANERLKFLAGQYLEFIGQDGKRRAFSLANSPSQEDLLEVHIRLIPGGEFTGYVFNGMKEKTILRFEGPLGTFFLREDSDKPMVFLAGGTGFAPIKSIIEYALEKGIDRPMTLYWGARNRAGLYLNALAEGWAAERGIRYVPVLSEPTPADAWTGRTGLVHEAVLADFQDLSGHQVYACGAPPMIEAAQRDFAARGLPAEEFYADAFTFTPPSA